MKTSHGRRRSKRRSLIVGVEPEKTFGEWFLEGDFLKEEQSMKAVVGDSITNKIFAVPLKRAYIFMEDVLT